jgi:LCP family protein required for cell wall assembly
MIDTTAHIKSSWVALLLSFLGFLAVGILAFSAFSLGYLAQHLYTVSQVANVSIPKIVSQVQQGFTQEPTNYQGSKTFLLLGTDAVANRDQEFVLTDTMMLVSIHLGTGNIHTLSLPRDLWLEEYQTKINALYYYGQAQNPANPEQFVQQVVSELIQVPIQHTMVISLESLSELIAIVDGVTIEVSEGFVDDKFPRSDSDLTSTDAAELYETVTFTKGTERMSSTRALAYIRSRMSGDDQGTDNARAARQQQVIQALFRELMQPSTLLDTQKTSQMYTWYSQQYEQTLPISEIVATGLALLPLRNEISFNPATFSIYPEDPNGVIEHPSPSLYQNLWVYRIRDISGFQTEVRTSLGLQQ